jgi:transposase
MKDKTSQTKPPVDREAVHILAISIGAREAARRLGIKESTLLSWSHRLKWKLPRRKVGRPPLELNASPGDVLLDYKRRGGLTRMDIYSAAAGAAERLARHV